MTLFCVIASNRTVSFHQAVVEIEAETEAEAIELARQRDAEGALPWERESEDQEDPTDYEAAPVQDGVCRFCGARAEAARPDWRCETCGGWNAHGAAH